MSSRWQWKRRVKSKLHLSLFTLSFFTLFLVSCSISYKFNGASIDYTKTKTIQINTFPIRSSYVWAPMQSIFNNRLTDIYAQQTKLQQVKRGGDLVLSGEITGFDQFNKGVGSDGYSSQVQLKMTVNVRFTNNKKHDEDFERRLAFSVFSFALRSFLAAAFTFFTRNLSS